MFSAYVRLVWLLPALGISLAANAQVAPQVVLPIQTQPTPLEEVPKVPGVSAVLRGFNAGLTFSQVHDSSAGWYNVVTPAVTYAFTEHYSADASLSIYPYRKVENQNPQTQGSRPLVRDFGEIGDTFLGLHASYKPGDFRNTTTALVSFPSGDRDDGLGTGQVTFDFSNRLERYWKQANLSLDLGGGDSSVLFNRLLSNDETSLGPLVHFQAGIVVYLPYNVRLQSLAYEQLPIGHQTVYATVSPPGSPNGSVILSDGASEDNGITTALAVPISDNLTLSGYYNRSVRQHLDTVSMGVTYVLRGTPRKKRHLSMIDRALREAEKDSP